MFMVCGLFGALIALLGPSHGTLGFSRLLGRLCRGPRTTLIVTWVMGILDLCGRLSEYHDPEHLHGVSSLTGRRCPGRPCPTSSTPPAHRCGLPALSPPGRCSFAGLFYAEAGIPELGYGAPSTPLRRDPFVFYAIAAVALVPPALPGAGAQAGADEEGLSPGGGDRKGLLAGERFELNLEDGTTPPAITGCLWDFVLPHRHADRPDYRGGELFLALVAAIAVCFCSTSPGRSCLSLGSARLAMHGFCNMIPTVAIIFFVAPL